MSEQQKDHKAWQCKIGAFGDVEVPSGGDAPMRRAVEEAFKNLTGRESEFTFSGWGSQLEESERAVVEGRASVEDHWEGFKTGQELVRWLDGGGKRRSSAFYEGVAAAIANKAKTEDL